MIYHAQIVELHVRIFKREGDAAELVANEEPYDGSLVIRICDGVAHVGLATGCFDFQVYKQLRDELFEKWHCKEIVWQGNGRVQKPKRRK